MNYSLRALLPSDVNYFYDWIVDPEVIKFSQTKFHTMTQRQQISDWFTETISDQKVYQQGIIDAVSKELIGYAGIAGINRIDQNGEYFIFIGNKNFWGKGIASGVTVEIIKAGFEELNLHRIFLTASSENTGALKAYSKAGFRHEGVMREAFFRGGQFSDKIIMGTLKSEYAITGT